MWNTQFWAVIVPKVNVYQWKEYELIWIILKPSSIGQLAIIRLSRLSLIKRVILQTAVVHLQVQGAPPTQIRSPYHKPQQVFTSIAVGLQSWVTTKLKCNTWSHEYVVFGPLLFCFPQWRSLQVHQINPTHPQNHVTIQRAFNIFLTMGVCF